jgi:hypothetical protein
LAEEPCQQGPSGGELNAEEKGLSSQKESQDYRPLAALAKPGVLAGAKPPWSFLNTSCLAIYMLYLRLGPLLSFFSSSASACK